MLLETTKMDSRTDVPMTTMGHGRILLKYHVGNFGIDSIVFIHMASNSTVDKLNPQEKSHKTRATRKNGRYEGYIIEHEKARCHVFTTRSTY